MTLVLHSRPPVCGLRKLFRRGKHKTAHRHTAFISLDREKRAVDLDEVKRIGFAPPAGRRCGPGLYYQRRLAVVEAVAMGRICNAAEMQMAREKNVGAARGDPRHYLFCPADYVVLVISARQIERVMSDD